MVMIQFKDSQNLMLAKEIDVVFHSDWMDRGVLPYAKHILQTNILKEQAPILSEIHYSKYNISEIPDSVMNRIMKNSDDGCCATEYVEEDNGSRWLHVYSTSNPDHSLLLKALSNILIMKHVKDIKIPLYLTNKMAHVRRHHYHFLNGLRNVESLILVSLKSGQFDKSRMMLNLPDVCSGHGLIATICRDYIQLPVYDSMTQNYVICPSAPPLGDITNCLNHLIYQDLLDSTLADRFPGILYSRWLDELFIVNEMNSKKVKFDTEAIENLLNELNLEGISSEIHAADDRGTDSSEYNVCGKDDNIGVIKQVAFLYTNMCAIII